MRLKLHQRLLEYRSSISPSRHSTASLMVGIELLTGLSDQLILDIVERCIEIKRNGVSMLVSMGVGSYDKAVCILHLIEEICKE